MIRVIIHVIFLLRTGKLLVCNSPLHVAALAATTFIVCFKGTCYVLGGAGGTLAFANSVDAAIIASNRDAIILTYAMRKLEPILTSMECPNNFGKPPYKIWEEASAELKSTIVNNLDKTPIILDPQNPDHYTVLANK